MARVYANIFCAIWDDADFCALSSNAQRTYFMLVTQQDITACGSLPLTLRRWSRTVAESDRRTLPDALAELEDARFVLVDEDTEELLVRSFVKHDGGYKHAKRVIAVIAYAKAIRSPRLRYAVADELRKLDVSGADEVAIECQSVGNDKASSSRRVVVTEVVTNHNPGTTTPEPESGNLEPSAVADAVIEPSRPEIDDLCTLLADLIEQNGSKRPTITERWRDACRRMLDIDGRTPQQIDAAIRWAQADEFWRANVLSMPKLREKYDQLRLSAERQRSSRQRPNADDRVRKGASLAEQLRARESRLEIGDGSHTG